MQYAARPSHIKEVMKRLFDPTKPHFAAWVWLYDIDCYWAERMPTIHLTQPEAVPLYHASLCGFIGLAEHLIVSHSSDANSRGGSHTTGLHAASHAASAKGNLKVASLLLRNGADPDPRDLSEGFRFIGCHRADSLSWRNHHSRSQSSSLIPERM